MLTEEGGYAMIEQDTVKLLRECDAGARMGMDSLQDVIGAVESPALKGLLQESRESHESLSREITQALHRFDDSGKSPHPMASGMSWLKTHAELAMNRSDATVADLMTDGCNMGVKSLSRYLNQYQAADEDSKALARKLVGLEEQLAQKIRPYL